MGKLGGSKVFSAIVPFVNSSDPEIQEVAIKALGNLGDKRGSQYIFRFLGKKRITSKTAAISVLAKLAPERLKPKLKNFLREGENSVKITALKVALKLGCSDCQNILKLLILKSEDTVSAEASVVASVLNFPELSESIAQRLNSNPILEAKIKYLWSLGNFGYAKVLKNALQYLNSPVPELRITSIMVLRLLRPRSPQVADKIADMIYDAEPSVASQAYRFLAEYGKSTFFSKEKIKKIKEPLVKSAIADSLHWLGPSSDKNAIIRSWVNSKNLKLKISAIKALGFLKDQKSVPMLLSLIYSQNSELKKNVVKTLSYIASPITKSTLKYIFKKDKNPIIKAYAALGLLKLGLDKQTLGQIAYFYEKDLRYNNPELNFIYSLILYKAGSKTYGKNFKFFFKKYILSGKNTRLKADLLDLIVFLDENAETWFLKAEQSKLYRVKSRALLYLAKFRNIKTNFSEKTKVSLSKTTETKTKSTVKLPFSSIKDETDEGCGCNTDKPTPDTLLFFLFLTGIIIFKHSEITRR